MAQPEGRVISMAGHGDQDLWEWNTKTPTTSVHSGNNFAQYVGSASGAVRSNAGSPTGPDMSTMQEQTQGLTRYGNSDVAIAQMKRNGSIGTQLWNWEADCKKAPSSSPESSEHGSNKMWNWSAGRESPSASVKGGMSRNGSVGSSLWNWGAGRASNPPSLPPSREASSHGGGNFKRVGSLGSRLSEMGKTPPAANNGPRAASVHGGSYFGGFAGGSPFRRGRTPPTSGPPSRASSVHGGSNFASIAEERPESKPEPKPRTRI